MSPDQWSRVRELLDEALDRPPDERADWLADACDDPALRREVEALLEAYDPDDPIFDAEGPPDLLHETEGRADGPVRPEPGTQVGAYRLVEEIGVGGTGVVYRAERADGAYERTVAVKLLQRRLRTDDAAERFRAERQILAGLDHPGIAELLDGGVTAAGANEQAGQPFLVMEYVDGVPITEYADAHDLDIDDRLALLQQVGTAVQAAHRQLVVHRDLKPSNVLVTETEDGPRVKLLDFGIAKLLRDEALSAPIPTTRTGRRWLTPAYAAPEQVVGDDISTATDVYQLGVLAYELLTGTRPFELNDKSPAEVERILTEETPPRPSERAADQTPQRESQLRGDLDTILRKALRKEPGRRYGSAEAFVNDLQRHRDGEPVAARPATLGYRTRKFVQRHRTGVFVAAVFALTVVAFVGVLLRQQAITERQRDRARTEARQAEEVTQFMAGLFRAAAPERSRGDTLTAYDLLATGRERIDELSDQPEVQAQVRHTIGETYRQLAEYDRAESLLRKALRQRRDVHGPTHPETVESLSALAFFLRDQGRYAEADSLFGRVIERHRNLAATPDSALVDALLAQAFVQRRQGHLEEAEQTVRSSLARIRTQNGGASMKKAEALHNLAAVLRDQGELEQAESVQRRALRLYRQLTDGPHPAVSGALNNLGYVLSEQGRYAAADSIYQQALQMERTLRGPQHPQTLTVLNNIAAARVERGQFKAAVPIYRQVIAGYEQKYDSTHSNLGVLYKNLGDALYNLDNLAGADSAYRASRRHYRGSRGMPSERLAGVLETHTYLKLIRDQHAAAERLARKSLKMQRALAPDDSLAVAEGLLPVAEAVWAQGRKGEADSIYRTIVKRFQAAPDPYHADLAAALLKRGRFALNQGDPERGLNLLEKAQRHQQAAEAYEPRRQNIQLFRGIALARLGREDEARSILGRLQEAVAGDTSRETRDLRQRLAQMLDSLRAS